MPEQGSVPGEETRQYVVQQKHFLALLSRKLLILFSAVGWGALDACSILATTDKVLEVQPNIPQLSLHFADDGLVFCSRVARRNMTHALPYPFLFFLPSSCSSPPPLLSAPSPFNVDSTHLSFLSSPYLLSQCLFFKYERPKRSVLSL